MNVCMNALNVNKYKNKNNKNSNITDWKYFFERILLHFKVSILIIVYH